MKVQLYLLHYISIAVNIPKLARMYLVGAVVSKDVTDNTAVGGVPARIIKTHFSPLVDYSPGLQKIVTVNLNGMEFN